MSWSDFRGLLLLQTPEGGIDRRALILLSLLLLAPVGLPLLPAFFNRIVRRFAQRFGTADVTPPHIRLVSLVKGVAIISVGWLLLGASLWAAVQATVAEAPPASWDTLTRYTAFMGVSYVAGFIILLVPSGIGVREFFLILCVAPDLVPLVGDVEEARALAVFAVLLLRLVWTAAELIMAGTLYWLPGPAPESAV